jgi:hypothetical protein
MLNEASSLFNKMPVYKLEPDIRTILSLMTGFAHINDIQKVIYYYSFLAKFNIKADKRIYTTLINAILKDCN